MVETLIKNTEQIKMKTRTELNEGFFVSPLFYYTDSSSVRLIGSQTKVIYKVPFISCCLAITHLNPKNLSHRLISQNKHIQELT